MGWFERFMAYLEGRARTRLYGTFLFWIVVVHTPIIMTWIFVSQDLIYKSTGLLKNEYIAYTYFRVGDGDFWRIEALRVLIAVVLTWLMIWILPKTILAKAYDRELTDDYGRKEKKIGKDVELEKIKQGLSTVKLETVKKEEKVIEKQEDLEQKEFRDWDKEYKALEPAARESVLEDIADSIYQHGGHIKRYLNRDANRWVDPQLETESIAMAHSMELVDLNNDNTVISLTQKGKYFLSRGYLSQGNKKS